LNNSLDNALGGGCCCPEAAPARRRQATEGRAVNGRAERFVTRFAERRSQGRAGQVQRSRGGQHRREQQQREVAAAVAGTRRRRCGRRRRGIRVSAAPRPWRQLRGGQPPEVPAGV
jgi:hypothetical protein